jgi:carboxymethylenebutenolidase
MIHEWWGLNEHIKHQADLLAQEGYVVLAVDLYHGEVATDINHAMELSSSVRNNSTEAIENLESAVRYVKSLEIVNGSRIASLGWCFGGDWSLRLALNSTENPLAATILYYGRPVTDADSLSKIKWPVLGIFGDKDQSIPVESVKQFASALNASKITNEIYLYQGVGHAFANPSGDNYAPQETVDAWHKTLDFLKEHL